MAELKDSYRRLSTKETLLHLLDNYENSAREVVEALMTAANSKTNNSDLNEDITKGVTKVIQKDEELQATIKLGEEQLARQQTISLVNEEIAKKDQELLQIQSHLQDAEQVLANTLYHAKKKVETLRKASEAAVSSEELIKFAFRISSGCAVEAPPDWSAGDPRRPYPLDIELRAGHLGRQLPTDNDALRVTQTGLSGIEPAPASLSSNGVSASDQLSLQSQDTPLDASTGSSLWQLTKMANDDIPAAAISPLSTPASLASTTASVEMSTTNHGRALNSAAVEFMSSSGDSSSSDSS